MNTKSIYKPSLALIDSGINLSNRHIENAIERTYRINEDGQATNLSVGNNDFYGHGTRMAGIIAKISPHVSIVDIGVLGNKNKCTTQMLASGINKAVDLDVDVISLALSSVGFDILPIILSINRALKRGIIVVAAYQNIPSNSPSIPAQLPGVFGVRRSTSQGVMEWLCRCGDLIEIGAYSSKIESVSRSGKSVMVRGNSSACSIISAVCCNFIAAHGCSNKENVLSYLCNNSCDRIEFTRHPSEEEAIS